ncbi:MAG TPA: ATP-binding cassette domain-containing protein, partial [Fodinibius sp.]|nr:ATP-binding cassette domain-containing protein [Fodinibius sp.]
MAKPIIQVQDLTKIYQMGNQEVRALDGVTFDILENEYIAIMGPSGSGKSTMMNLIGCLDTPTSGQYVLNNQDVSQLDDAELAEVRNREIGFVFQTFNLLPRTDCLSNVELPLIYAGVKTAERHAQAERTLQRVG